MVPLLSSILKSSFVVLKSPSLLFIELLSEFLSRVSELIGEMGELWVGEVLILHGHIVFLESSHNLVHKDGLVLLDEWTIATVLEGDGVLGDSHELLVHDGGLVSGHSHGPELHWGGSLGIVSVLIGVLGESTDSLVDLGSELIELLVVVEGITSVDHFIEVSLGSLVMVFHIFNETHFDGLLLVPVSLEVWSEVIVDELLHISSGGENFLLESLSGSSVNNLVWVLGSGDEGDEGSVFHIFWFN